MSFIDDCNDFAPHNLLGKLKLFLSKDKQKICLERQNE